MENETTQETVKTADDSSPEEVTEAKSLGWKSPDEWKGDPPAKGFMTAHDYVERGRTMLPIVNSQLVKERERSAKLADELESHKRQTAATVKNIERMSKAALDQQRAQIEEQFSARKEAAVEVGDTAGYRRHVEAEKVALTDLDKRLEPTADEKRAAEQPATLPASIQATIDAWRSENGWYGVDEDMSDMATRHHNRLMKSKPGLSLRENLDEVTEYVRAELPHKFKRRDKEAEGDDDTPAPRRGSAVEGGSRMNGGGTRSQWSKVPADARQVAENADHIQYFLKPGETMEKNAAQARERWAAKYLESEA